jgi:hypothetical protein
VSVEINRGTWPELPIFGLMQQIGNVSDHEMFRTFNMGIGMIVVCSEIDKDNIANGVNDCYEIGRVASGSQAFKSLKSDEIILDADRVVGFLQPGPQLLVEIVFGTDVHKMTAQRGP